MRFFHPRYYPKIKGDILENKEKNKCICFNDIIWLMIIKMGLEMKNRSQSIKYVAYVP